MQHFSKARPAQHGRYELMASLLRRQFMSFAMIVIAGQWQQNKKTFVNVGVDLDSVGMLWHCYSKQRLALYHYTYVRTAETNDAVRVITLQLAPRNQSTEQALFHDVCTSTRGKVSLGCPRTEHNIFSGHMCWSSYPSPTPNVSIRQHYGRWEKRVTQWQTFLVNSVCRQQWEVFILSLLSLHSTIYYRLTHDISHVRAIPMCTSHNIGIARHFPNSVYWYSSWTIPGTFRSQSFPTYRTWTCGYIRAFV
jgi:hypothetical protein